MKKQPTSPALKVKKYWVTMTDTFMSGWGRADGRICKYVYECDSYEQAAIVEQNAINHGQKYVNITSKNPSYPVRTHLTMYKTNDGDNDVWYTEGGIKKS